MDAMPALYTHARCPKASVHHVLVADLRSTFVPRLSSVATEEFTQLSTVLAEISLTNAQDVRRCPWEDKAHRLSSSMIYKSIIAVGGSCDYYKFIWENRAPPKVKFFGWLLVQDRIQIRENLLKKNCIDSDLCELCGA